ncbi:unnamed protein product [Urochloa humidicola]
MANRRRGLLAVSTPLSAKRPRCVARTSAAAIIVGSPLPPLPLVIVGLLRPARLRALVGGGYHRWLHMVLHGAPPTSAAAGSRFLIGC